MRVKAMRYLTGGNAKHIIQADNASAVDAVVAVLRRHSGTAVLQAFACVLYVTSHMIRSGQGTQVPSRPWCKRCADTRAITCCKRGRHRGRGCGDAHARVSCGVAGEGLWGVAEPEQQHRGKQEPGGEHG